MECLLALNERASAVCDRPESVADPLHIEIYAFVGIPLTS